MLTRVNFRKNKLIHREQGFYSILELKEKNTAKQHTLFFWDCSPSG